MKQLLAAIAPAAAIFLAGVIIGLSAAGYFCRGLLTGTGNAGAAKAPALPLLQAITGFTQPGAEVHPTSEIFRDTIINPVKCRDIKITRWKARLEHTADTRLVTRPFTASCDTVLHGDTAAISYSFPGNLFTMNLRGHADSITRINTREIIYGTRKEKWWAHPAFAAAGIAAGIIVTLILKR